MARLRTRRLTADDDAAFNEAYLRFTHDRWPDTARSLELMRWLWHRSPAGPTQSWLVEAEAPDGSWRIVGHHGLCPIRFTLGDRDLVCAKTTNTYLLPEFRSEFLYLRFEQQCLADAGRCFDATYSNAPGMSRLRGTLGYVATDQWIQFEHGSAHFDVATRAFTRVVQRRRRGAWPAIARTWANAARRMSRRPALTLVEYTPDEARQSAFFADFWQQARGGAGLSPRRDVVDLTWRYWQRPGAAIATLSHSWPGGARAYAIVDFANPYHYHLVDFFVTPTRADLLELFLDGLFDWSHGRGALTLSFGTTAAGQPPPLMEVFKRRMRPHPLTRFRPPSQFAYRLAPRGHAAGLTTAPVWNVTDFMIVERPITLPSPSSTRDGP